MIREFFECYTNSIEQYKEKIELLEVNLIMLNYELVRDFDRCRCYYNGTWKFTVFKQTNSNKFTVRYYFKENECKKYVDLTAEEAIDHIKYVL